MRFFMFMLMFMLVFILVFILMSVALCPGKLAVVSGRKAVRCDADLTQAIDALRTPGRSAGRVDCWQQ